MSDPQPQEQDKAPVPSPTEPAVPPADPDDFDKERAMATIKTLRAFEKEAKAKLRRLEDLEKTEADRKQADLSESERLKQELAALKSQHEQAEAALRQARIKDAARAAAEGLKLAFQPGALDDLVTLGAFADLEISERGQVLEINQAIKDLQKAKPYLFVAAQTVTPADIGATANGRQNTQDAKQAALARNATRWGIKLRE